ncbi:MAG: STAS/SEC14 domain-containing protein [Rhizobiaceae bacterium]
MAVLKPRNWPEALDELLELSEDVANGKMVQKISDFAIPDIGYFRVGLQRLPKLFGLLSKFYRCAVICDEGWVRKASEIKGRLIPGIEIKSFGSGEEEQAEKWIAGG